ncbi:gas vesicle synthesis protein GvpA [Calothrix sp. NIES-2100]|nr:gas vesicle synthesis protein GvpA [Calothrix sp. NIES-2100]
MLFTFEAGVNRIVAEIEKSESQSIFKTTTMSLRYKKMAVEKTNSSSSLAEVIDRILDKGIVVDAWVRVSLVGIELLAIEARIVIASVETYLKYAEAVGLTQSAAVPA